MTFDIWLLAAICLFVFAIGAIIRVYPGPTLRDRLISVNIAATLACAGALAITVSTGSLLVIVLAAILACIVFAVTIHMAEGTTVEA
ncbi:MAG: hypothetical protein WC342_08095 [Methanoregula sp.]|jgi:multisubunit Na+/H+ antiporter MnhF subunit